MARLDGLVRVGLDLEGDAHEHTAGPGRGRAPRLVLGVESDRRAGLHCESGDVLIDDVLLPDPRSGDLLAVPATGAYALAMSSNYNATPRPAAVLVADTEARLIRRRETIDDLLAFEYQE